MAGAMTVSLSLDCKGWLSFQTADQVNEFEALKHCLLRDRSRLPSLIKNAELHEWSTP